jgi:hypothetical protein
MWIVGIVIVAVFVLIVLGASLLLLRQQLNIEQTPENYYKGLGMTIGTGIGVLLGVILGLLFLDYPATGVLLGSSGGMSIGLAAGSAFAKHKEQGEV